MSLDEKRKRLEDLEVRRDRLKGIAMSGGNLYEMKIFAIIVDNIERLKKEIELSKDDYYVPKLKIN